MIAAAVLAYMAARPEIEPGPVAWYEHPVPGGYVVEYQTETGEIVPVRFVTGQRCGHLAAVVVGGRLVTAARIEAVRP